MIINLGGVLNHILNDFWRVDPQEILSIYKLKFEQL
jgi:hypothetical protein